MFKKTAIAGLVAAALGSGLAQAQAPAAPAAPASPHTLTGNMGLFSQYIFRGLKQTNGEPALQGGFDYSHASGFYAGTWGSNVSWLRDGGAYQAGGSLELDLYGGYKWGFAPDWTLDLGTLYYWYPGDASTLANPLNPKANTWEIYAGLSWKWLSAKFSYSIDKETFAVLDSKGTYYFDLTATYPIPNTPVTVIAHYGMQKFKGTDPRFATVANNDTLFSYDDWKIGLNYALPKDFTIGIFYSDTSGADPFGYGSTTTCGAFGCGVYPKDISKGTGTIFISKTF